MKIGIDIDDTLTNIKEELDNAWDEYYIITARDSEFHKDPYKLSKDWQYIIT